MLVFVEGGKHLARTNDNVNPYETASTRITLRAQEISELTRSEEGYRPFVDHSHTYVDDAMNDNGSLRNPREQAPRTNT